MSKSLKFGFVMDPIENVLVDKDTTFVMILEAQERGHEIYFINPGSLSLTGKRVSAVLEPMKVMRAGPHYEKGEGRRADLSELDLVFMRVDPPFTMEYVFLTYVLEYAERDVPIMNKPTALRDANEKLFALNWPELMTPTIVTRSMDEIRDFTKSQRGKAVIKPLDGCGGEGVFVLDSDDRNLTAILEQSTLHGTKLAMVQGYIPEAREGDKRIIMLNGEPIGATLRVPSDDENRGNIHVGGTCVKTEITASDKKICDAVGPKLREKGLYMVGLDVIGKYLTEVNVTSPTGVQEIDRLSGVNLEAKIIDFAESMTASAEAASST